ncbi:GAF domain-containing protein [Haloplanus aerogenes]|uniref:histidine kinase n=1 Tax=Haloplanus aerogenes TaxID=660522 RepID=A0A3M0DSV1_9EURY|nr:GAF domain-containing protein [Haloplanus aerogenes]AZH24520.1 GAF domain-containing protein [Haloplanus aerogenes]RMB23830.1 histidine kinase/DNA gyrase B/HSP90-like ATPase [Haloplanus aerogenes]
MGRLSARTSGTIICGAGLVLAVFHLQSAVRLQAFPALVLIEAIVPLALALFVAGAGALIREGDIAPTQHADRVLGWTTVGMVALSVAVGWLFVDAAIRGQDVPAAARTVGNATTLGALVGLVVGVYDARGQCQRRRAEQLTRINDTLRIATQEMVNATGRSELEQEVCERLTDSNIYDSAWIGRYTPGDEFVRPAAWAGHDDEYIDSLEVTVDPTDPTGQGPGGESIRTGEIQPIQDVFDDPSLKPWWDLLAEKGVESMAVVPLVGANRNHGFLSVYANRVNAFDPQEQEALSELGESIGHTIDSMAAREQLARREQELARQNKRLDEFASVVSHDLRNPLTVATGNLDLVQMEVDDERLDRIAGALDRMDELIDDLLTLSRYGRTVNDVKSVDLRSIAENAWTTTDTEHARLRFDGDPGTVEADESRLTQVFENLFRNSVEHGSTDSRPEADDSVEHGSTDSSTTTDTPLDAGGADNQSSPVPAEGADSGDFRRGGHANDDDDTPEVTITVGRTTDGFYIEDDGPGIPESEREKVFETGYSTDPEGTGFGLNIVRTIAEAHGWAVDVTEGAAGGARFEFTTTGVEMRVSERAR